MKKDREDKIRVLQSMGSLGLGGTEMFVMNFFRHINKDKFQVDFLVYDSRDDFREEVLDSGSKIYLCPYRKGRKIKRFYQNMKYVHQILSQNQYDIIHCHSCSFLGILCGVLPAKRSKEIKIISHSHSAGSGETKGLKKGIQHFLKFLICNSVDLGFACSDLAGNSKYTRNFIEGNKFVILHNAIDIERYRFNDKNRLEIRKEYNWLNHFVIGNVGRLSEEKNQKRLIYIFSYIYQHRPDARLLIVGGGELEKDLQNQVKIMGLDKAVIFTGSVRDVERYYSSMDVFVMTSHFEGLPFTAIEAQVNGLKCVFSDCITKMVDITGEADFLSLTESDKSWAESILRLSGERCHETVLGRVCQDYDLEKECKKLEKYYEKLAAL